MRSLVNALPTPLLVIILVGLILGITLIAVQIVRRFVPSTQEGFDAEVSSQVLGVVASLFGLLLAFVVVIEFQAFTDASANVGLEADNVAAVARDSRAFDKSGGSRVRAAVGEYVRAVVDDEWPRMKDGQESAPAWSGLNHVFDAMQTYEPRTDAQRAFYDDAVRHLNTVLEARSNRLEASDGNDLPPLVAALVLVGSIVIVGYATLVGSRSSAFHAIGAGAIAIVIGFALVVLLALQFPFSGGLAITPQPFKEGTLATYFDKTR
jgi:hypothetical protein